MMPPREWLKPPRSLLIVLSLVTLVSVSALGWFGWKLLDQERAVEAQRARERLEQGGDRRVAIARGTLAEAGERVGTWLIVRPPWASRTRVCCSSSPTETCRPHHRRDCSI